MGSLSNLYISQSYQSLIHLATNNTASATLIDLQDGLGNSIGVSVNTGGDLNLSGSLTASLQQGYVLVGNGNNRTSLVSTSSFGGGGSTDITSLNQFTASQLNINAGYNQYTSSTNIRLNNLESTSASVNISISNLNSTTASQGISISNLNAYTQSNNQKWDNIAAQSGSWITESETGSFLITASFDNGTRNLTFTKGNNTTFNVNIPDVSGSAGVPAGTISGSAQITALGFVSSSITESSVITASIAGPVLTFTKGDASTFNVIIPTGSATFVTGSYGAFQDNTTQSGSANVSQSIKLGTTDLSDGVYVTDTTKINVAYAGTYDIQFSAQVDRLTGSGTDTVYFWLKKNGVNVPSTTGQITISGGALEAKTLAAWNYFIDAAAGDYFELVWQKTDNNIVLAYTAASGNIPAVPSMIATVSRVDVGGGNNMVTTASFNAYTASQNIINTNVGLSASLYEAKFATIGTQSGSWGGGGSIDTGSFATTGSNVFTGIQTFADAGLNATSLVSTSGSLMLVAKSYNSSSAHMTASANLVNLIFKDNNNSGSAIITGSNNIIGNPLAPTAEFRRYISNGNIALFGALPQLTSSMAFPVSMNGNFLQSNANNITLRGPVSSSTWTVAANIIQGTVNIGNAPNPANRLVSGLTLSTNTIPGALTVFANQNSLSSSLTITANTINGGALLVPLSSSLTFSNNIVLDNAFTWTNNYYSNSVGLGLPTSNRNIFLGTANTITTTGIAGTVAVAQQPNINNNLIGGQSNTLFINATNASTSTQLVSNIIYGNTLIVTGSSTFNGTNIGSAFFGRYNANDGRRNSTPGTIFAVGTGTAAGSRKTGFLIDSGSNTFIEGTLNVSGSTILTGSIISVDNSGNATNTIIGLNALGMGNAGAQPLAVGNTISVAIGNGAMRFASGSSQNVAIGNNALLITTGSGNFALGSEALANNTTGASNIAIGQNALNSNNAGNSNLSIGNNSGFRVSGSNNTFVGESAGYNLVGSNNTILGRYQGSTGELLDNNIILADGSGTIKAQYSGSAWSLQDGIKLNKGTNKTTDIVSVNTTATVTNSLVTAESIILLTTQNGNVAGTMYPAVVMNKGAGTFDIVHDYAGSLDVAYLIINPTS